MDAESFKDSALDIPTDFNDHVNRTLTVFDLHPDHDPEKYLRLASRSWNVALEKNDGLEIQNVYAATEAVQRLKVGSIYATAHDRPHLALFYEWLRRWCVATIGENYYCHRNSREPIDPIDPATGQ